MKTEKLHFEELLGSNLSSKDYIVNMLRNVADLASFHSLSAQHQAIRDEIQMVLAMTDAEFSEYTALESHGIMSAINVVQERAALYNRLNKGVSGPLNDATLIAGTNINGRPLNEYASDNNCGAPLCTMGTTPKGVVVKAISDKELPTDAEGNKADLSLHDTPVSKTVSDDK